MMLKRDEIKEILASIHDAHWVKSTRALLDSLPVEHRETVALSLDPERAVKYKLSDFPKMLRAQDPVGTGLQQAAGRILLNLSAADRLALLEKLLPGKARHVEAGLTVVKRRPLIIDSEGRPCRFSTGEPLVFSQAAWLSSAIEELGPLRATVPDLATYLSHMETYSDIWPCLLAGVIDAGGEDGERVLEALLASLGEMPRSGDGLHNVIDSLLSCGRPEAWKAVERTLLKSKAHEGVQRFILENALQGHPGAFTHMLRVVLDHDLYRLPSVVRAAGVWFQFLWGSAPPSGVKASSATVLKYLDNPRARSRAITNGTSNEAYFALWAASFDDFHTMLPLADKALASKQPMTRYAAVHLLASLGIRDTSLRLVKAVDDADIRVAVRALDYFQFPCYLNDDVIPHADAAFDAIERLWARLPRKTTKIPSALWPWTERKLKATDVSEALFGHTTPSRLPALLQHSKRLSEATLVELAHGLGVHSNWRLCRETRSEIDDGDLPETFRCALVSLLGHRSVEVVENAVRSLSSFAVEPDEEQVLTSVVESKVGLMRGIALKRLAGLPDSRLLALAARFLHSSTANQRVLGLEVLQSMVESKRSTDAVRQLLDGFALGKKPTPLEKALLTRIDDARLQKPRREDAFGLLNPAGLTVVPKARALPILSMTSEAWEVLLSLAGIVLAHKDLKLPRSKTARPSRDPLFLGQKMFWAAELPEAGQADSEAWSRCPVASIIRPWLDARPKTFDNLNLLRGLLAFDRFNAPSSQDDRLAWPKDVLEVAKKRNVPLKTVPNESLQYLLYWLMRFSGERGYAAAFLDSAEGAIAAGLFGKTHAIADETFPKYRGEDLRATALERHPNLLFRCFETWFSEFKSLVKQGVVAHTRRIGPAFSRWHVPPVHL